jgi:hypothetical protein
MQESTGSEATSKSRLIALLDQVAAQIPLITAGRCSNRNGLSKFDRGAPRRCIACGNPSCPPADIDLILGRAQHFNGDSAHALCLQLAPNCVEPCVVRENGVCPS